MRARQRWRNCRRVDRLIERLQVESSSREERESVYRRLLETMTEAMLVERDGIQLANARFAELAGVVNPGKLFGRRLADLVHPTTPNSSPNTCAAMRRRSSACAARSRTAAGCCGPAARLELSFSRTMLDRRPAVIVTGVEMSPRSPAETGGSRSHGSAWEALDSLAESVLTTDVDGRIVYVNSAGEQLMGKSGQRNPRPHARRRHRAGGRR